jgi:hypothetical protein
VRWHGDGNLELSRQVVFAVERFLEVSESFASDLLLVKPDLDGISFNSKSSFERTSA